MLQLCLSLVSFRASHSGKASQNVSGGSGFCDVSHPASFSTLTRRQTRLLDGMGVFVVEEGVEPFTEREHEGGKCTSIKVNTGTSLFAQRPSRWS